MDTRYGHAVRDYIWEAKTFDFDKEGVIDFTTISNHTMCTVQGLRVIKVGKDSLLLGQKDN